MIKRVRQRKPLIHCITNPISIHDCANVILAAGGRPIMAEHPKEVCQITKSAQALVLNLGNITDVRMESMNLSLYAAGRNGIPAVLDLVGIACSDLRFFYTQKLMQQGKPAILKGNMSEMLKMAGLPSHSIGVDAGEEDLFSEENRSRILPEFQKLSEETGAVLVVSGERDLIVGEGQIYFAANGAEMMSCITGTGCMLGALCGVYLSEGEPLTAALTAVSMMGVAGEMAAGEARGPGDFQSLFLNALYGMNENELQRRLQIERIV